MFLPDRAYTVGKKTAGTYTAVDQGVAKSDPT